MPAMTERQEQQQILGKRNRDTETVNIKALQRMLVKAIATPIEDYERCLFLFNLLRLHVEATWQVLKCLPSGTPTTPGFPVCSIEELSRSPITSGSQGRAILATAFRDIDRICSAWKKIQEEGFIETHAPLMDPRSQFAKQNHNKTKKGPEDIASKDGIQLLQWLNARVLYDEQKKSGLSVPRFLDKKFGGQERYMYNVILVGRRSREIEALNGVSSSSCLAAWSYQRLVDIGVQEIDLLAKDLTNPGLWSELEWPDTVVQDRWNEATKSSSHHYESSNSGGMRAMLLRISEA